MRSPVGRAIAFTAPARAELLDSALDAGAPLESDEVVGRTLASLTSPGTEINGEYLREHRHPIYPGYAAVFEVEACGEAVTDLSPGDRVFCLGHHASRQRHRREEVVPVPAEVPTADAPYARLAGVSMATLTLTPARPPARVFVTGLGLVGHLATQVFRVAGYEVAGSDPADRPRELAAGKGVDVFAHLPHDDPAHRRQYDLVLECAGHEQAALDACELLRKGGEMSLVAAYWQPRTDLLMQQLLRTIFFRFLTIRSGWEWQLPRQRQPFGAGSHYENYAAALRWLAEGRLDVTNLANTAAPQDAQQVYQDLLHQRQQGLATIFDWTQL